ncbi:MAG: transcription elongation factor NusA, utilization substance protein [Candidatus Parcubacteria bacterium]|jgi:N utilization substance protein A
MFDLKVINSVMAQLEEERGISRNVVIEAIELALANAYRKEFGKKGQIVRASFDLDSGNVEFSQVKVVVDRDTVIMEDEPEEHEAPAEGEEEKVYFNDEQHILLEDARLIKGGAHVGEEIVFPLEKRDDFGRIAAQTAKQVITQKIREAEKSSVLAEFGQHEGSIVSGTVERMERGAVYLDMGRALGMLPYEEQIPGERFKQGERVRAYLYKVDETSRGVFLKLSRSHPKFLEELFKAEVPELAQGIVEIKAIAREAGSRSKVAVLSHDDHVDPVGALVGQRGVRVSTVTSELGGEKIDIIEWSADASQFVEEALSPAHVVDITLEETEESRIAKVLVAEDQQSLAIGKGGQNVRLAAKLTGWKIDISSAGPREEDLNEGDEEGFTPLGAAVVADEE